jgi:hypothetical protein
LRALAVKACVFDAPLRGHARVAPVRTVIGHCPQVEYQLLQLKQLGLLEMVH